MQKCLVVGGAGFIGSNLVDELINQGYEVTVIDNLLTGKKENINSKAEFIEADIRDLEKIKPIFIGVDYVFHLAALPRIQLSIDDPIKSNDINLNGTLNVLVAARDAKVKRFIYSASSSAYGRQLSLPWVETMPPNPISPYGLQKYVGEVYAKIFYEIYGLPTVCLRYFNIYGKRQPNEGAYCSVISNFLKQKQNGEPLTIVGDGVQTRDFTGVADAVKANIMAAENEKVGHGELINIGRGQPYSVNEVANMIGGPKINIAPRFEVSGSYADNNLAKKLLGWEPTVDLANWIEDYKKEMGL
ncbi:MAG: NAD-dependent epimerase/dehydratase family protein [bacterium]